LKLREKCPECGRNLVLDKACCEEREKGWLLVKACPEGCFSEKWNPIDLFPEEKNAV